jgi:uncharacterized membrane protein YhiD involved in acid resistance
VFEGLDLTSTATPPLPSLLINLAVGVFLSLILRWHFKTFSSTLSNREGFAKIFPFIVLTTVLIISVVKASLALSLGLVGALSIVRFRTPIKEPEELAYLFVAIAMGLGLGADQTLTTVIASLSILGVVALFNWARRDREQKNLYLSVDWKNDSPESAGQLEQLTDMITQHALNSDLRRFDIRGDSAEVTYFVDLSDSDKLSALVGDLQRTFPGIGVTFIDQSRMPSI